MAGGQEADRRHGRGIGAGGADRAVDCSPARARRARCPYPGRRAGERHIPDAQGTARAISEGDDVIQRALALVVLSLLVASALFAQTISVEGVKFEPAATVGGTALVLNGAGLRTRAFFKVYAAGLYVPQKSGDAATLLAQDGPRRMSIGMLRDVDATTFANSLIEGLKSNNTEQQLAAIGPQVEQMQATLKGIGEAKKGDAIQLDWIPESGTRIVVNGQPRGEPIPGPAFFTALLRIWLGERPADSSLKK